MDSWLSKESFILYGFIMGILGLILIFDARSEAAVPAVPEHLEDRYWELRSECRYQEILLYKKRNNTSFLTQEASDTINTMCFEDAVETLAVEIREHRD